MSLKKTRILELRKQGLTLREIQKEMGMSAHSLVSHYLKQTEYKHVSPALLKKEIWKWRRKAEKYEKKLNQLKDFLKD